MLPVKCPGCMAQLEVRNLKCGECGTEVSGSYPLPLLARLSEEEQDFIKTFVKKSGSIKEMASYLKLSYPTVRNMLNDIIEKIELYEK